MQWIGFSVNEFLSLSSACWLNIFFAKLFLPCLCLRTMLPPISWLNRSLPFPSKYPMGETTSTDSLKALYTFGYYQRPVFFTSQHMHTITNLWKCELNWSSKLRDSNDKKKHPYHTKLCAFRCLISRPQNLNLRSRNQIRRKLRKLRYFRGSCFSQCFILSEALHCLLPNTFYADNYFE